MMWMIRHQYIPVVLPREIILLKNYSRGLIHRQGKNCYRCRGYDRWLEQLLWMYPLVSAKLLQLLLELCLMLLQVVHLLWWVMMFAGSFSLILFILLRAAKRGVNLALISSQRDMYADLKVRVQILIKNDEMTRPLDRTVPVKKKKGKVPLPYIAISIIMSSKTNTSITGLSFWTRYLLSHIYWWRFYT